MNNQNFCSRNQYVGRNLVCIYLNKVTIILTLFFFINTVFLFFNLKNSIFKIAFVDCLINNTCFNVTNSASSVINSTFIVQPSFGYNVIRVNMFYPTNSVLMFVQNSLLLGLKSNESIGISTDYLLDKTFNSISKMNFKFNVTLNFYTTAYFYNLSLTNLIQSSGNYTVNVNISTLSKTLTAPITIMTCNIFN